MGEWYSDVQELNACILEDEAAQPISTGSATIEYWINQGGITKYLQSDLATFSTTYNTFTASFDSRTGWGHRVTPLEAWIGLNVSLVMRHSVYGEFSEDTNLVLDSTPAPTGDLEVKLVP